MRIFSVVLGIWLSGSAASYLSTDFYSALVDPANGWNSDTTIYTSNSTGFQNVTQRWSTYEPPTYSVAISPATESDVQKAVKIARAFNFPFLATGGRHGISTTLSLEQNGLAIDLHQLNSAIVDSEAGTLTIGGGARFGDIYEPVFAAGHQMPVGASSCPGMIGATIGAGVGREQGIHGLDIDSMVSVNIVTATGALVTASESENADLFWGVRGAGGNFGIITSATFNVWPLVNNGQAMNADFLFPPSSNVSYFEIIQSLNNSMPAELGTISIINYNSTAGETQILANWVYFGPEEEGRSLIAPLLDLDPILASISMVPWNKLVETALLSFDTVACVPGRVTNSYGLNLLQLDGATFQGVFKTMDDYYAASPDGRGDIFELEVFSNHQVLETPDDATAYPYRESKGYILTSFNGTDLGSETGRQIRSDCVATSGFDGLHVYVNYAHGDETVEEIWTAEKLPKLANIKKQWDPDNVFGYDHALPTSYP